MAAVTNLAKHLGWMTYHPFWSVRSTPGFPDLTLVKPPRIIFAELKTETGRLTSSQCQWIETLQHCDGVRVFVWRPSDWDFIVKCLQGNDTCQL